MSKDIDRRIAVEVMEWSLVNGIWADDNGLPIIADTRWNPKDNISQAMGDGKRLDTVVGKMQEYPNCVGLYLEYDGKEWGVMFGEKMDRWSTANAPAMAICLAALEAKGE